MGYSLYKIDEMTQDMLDNGFAVDDETGEVFSEVDLEKLCNDKEEDYALYMKSLEAEIKAMKDEKKNLEDRIGKKQNKLTLLKNGLLRHLQFKNEKGFETPRVKVSTRISHPLVIDNEEALINSNDSRIVKTKLTLDKTAIKKNIEDFKEYAHIDDKVNLSVK